MKANFNIQINSSFGNSKPSKNRKGMTPQEEYWLNRFLRDYAGKLVLIFVLFLVFLFGIIYLGTVNENVSTSKSVNINLSR